MDNEPGVSLAALRRSQAENASERSGRVEATITSIDLSIGQWMGVILRFGVAYVLLLLLFVAVPTLILVAIGGALNASFENATGPVEAGR